MAERMNQTARLSTAGLPNGQAVNFSYYGNTGDQRLQEIKNLNPSSNMQSQFDYAYNAVGQITSWQQNNSGLAAAKTYGLNYDDANQLAGATLTVSGSSAPSASYAYGYDKAGNRTQEQTGSATTTSTYNGLNQLTGQSAGGLTHFSGKLSEWANVTVGGSVAAVNSVVTTSGTSFNFDGAVNLASGTNTVPIVATDASGNTKTKNYQVVVPEGSGKTLTYDLLGNMTSDGTRNYVWDAANRLIKIWYGAAGSSASTEMTYDGMSRRTQIVEKDASGTVASTKQFVWDGMGIAEERDASNNVTKRFFAQGEQIASNSYYYAQDHLGSIREMTDSTGAIRARYNYDLWGRLAKEAGDMDTSFAFTGYYWHQPSGLHLAPFRAYSTDLGRWISRDPIAERGGINLYDYVGNDPINDYDPFGLERSCSQWYYEGTDVDIGDFLVRTRPVSAWMADGQPFPDRYDLTGDVAVNVIFNERRKWERYGLQIITKKIRYRRWCSDTCGPSGWEYKSGTVEERKESHISFYWEYRERTQTNIPFTGPAGPKLE